MTLRISFYELQWLGGEMVLKWVTCNVKLGLKIAGYLITEYSSQTSATH